MQGLRAQGNEFSYFMLLASAYMLNGVQRELQASKGMSQAVFSALYQGTSIGVPCSAPRALHHPALPHPCMACSGRCTPGWTAAATS
jgi:hypothetical protein